MTFVTYLLIGMVVWAIATVETYIREGWESVKASHSKGWMWFTDIISVALLWPSMVACYAAGMIITAFNKLRRES